MVPATTLVNPEPELACEQHGQDKEYQVDEMTQLHVISEYEINDLEDGELAQEQDREHHQKANHFVNRSSLLLEEMVNTLFYTLDGVKKRCQQYGRKDRDRERVDNDGFMMLDKEV